MALSIIDQLLLSISGKRQFRILFFDDRDQLKPEALKFFAWLHDLCHVNRVSYKFNTQLGGIDPYATHIAEGRREIWIELNKMLRNDTARIEAEINRLKEDETWTEQ